MPAGVKPRGVEGLNKVQNSADLQDALFASLERINVCTTGHATLQAALQAGRNDAEDALIAESCKSGAADYLLTCDREQQGFRNLSIPALTPEVFFKLFEIEHGVTYTETTF